MKYVFDLFLTTMKQTHTHEINRKKDKMIKYHLISKKPTDYSFGAVACKRTSGYNFTHCYHGVEWEEFKGLSVDRKCKRCANSVTSKFRERKDNEILENSKKKERRTK